MISSRRSCLNPVAAGSRDIDGGDGGGSGDGSGSGNVVVAFVDNGVVVVVG